MSPDFAPQQLTRAVLAAAFLLLVALSALRLRELWTTRRPPAWFPVGLTAIFVVGLGLRVWLSPRTFLHEYFHETETISRLLWEADTGIYGDTAPALYRLVAYLFGGDTSAVLRTNTVLSALCVPAVGLCTLALFGGLQRALLASLTLALLPQHLRFSGAEDQFVVAVLFMTWSTAFFADFVRSRGWLPLFGTVLSLALALHSRPELFALPPALLLLAFTALPPGQWKVLVSKKFLVGLALLAMLVSYRTASLFETFGGVLGQAAIVYPGDGPPRSFITLSDARVTPWAFWVLLELGVFALLRNARLVHLWLLAVGCGSIYLAGLFYSNAPYAERSQLIAAVLFVVFASGAIETALALARRWKRLGWSLGALLALLPVLGLSLHLDYVRQENDQQAQWRFLEESIPALPVEGTLLAPMRARPRRHNLFPMFLLDRHAKALVGVDFYDLDEGGSWPAPAGLVFFQGMHCFFSIAYDESAWIPAADLVLNTGEGSPSTPRPMHRSCAKVRAHYLWKPIVTRIVSAPPHAPGHHDRSGDVPFELGFFAATGLAPGVAPDRSPPMIPAMLERPTAEQAFPPGLFFACFGFAIGVWGLFGSRFGVRRL